MSKVQTMMQVSSITKTNKQKKESSTKLCQGSKFGLEWIRAKRKLLNKSP